MFNCPQDSIYAIFEKRVTHGPTDPRNHGPTDPWTHGPTDPRTDKASYRDAWTHLKMAVYTALVACCRAVTVIPLGMATSRQMVNRHRADYSHLRSKCPKKLA